MPVPVSRVLLTRRWVLLTALLLAVVAFCAALGWWQWQRGNVVVTQPAATLPVVPVGSVVSPTDPLTGAELGRRVRVQGEWDPGVQLRVPGRRLDGADGAWVLGMVRLGDGTGVPVVRGWIPEGAAAPAAGGPVTLEGVVQAPEAQSQASGRRPLPAGQSWVVSPAMLVNQVTYPVVPAYVAASEPSAAPLRAVSPPDPGSATRHLDWRNIGYAVQWLVFALFAVVVWARALRDDLQHPGGRRPDPPPHDPDHDEPHHDDPHHDDPHHDDPRHDRHHPQDGSARLLEERTR